MKDVSSKAKWLNRFLGFDSPSQAVVYGVGVGHPHA